MDSYFLTDLLFCVKLGSCFPIQIQICFFFAFEVCFNKGDAFYSFYVGNFSSTVNLQKKKNITLFISKQM